MCVSQPDARNKVGASMTLVCVSQINIMSFLCLRSEYLRFPATLHWNVAVSTVSAGPPVCTHPPPANRLFAARCVSWQWVNVVRLLKLTALRDVWVEEIETTTRRWARDQRKNPLARS